MALKFATTHSVGCQGPTLVLVALSILANGVRASTTGTVELPNLGTLSWTTQVL